MSKFLSELGDWFERQKRVLPWREDAGIYRVWISEIMLQQTQVATVLPYFERFIGRFPDVKTLAEAPLEDVLLHWAGLGYYSRARNVHRAAGLIHEAGRFPGTREEWEKIPGVGPYTAGAILSIALDQPEAILDGNVERVLSRFREMTRDDGDAAYKAALWELSAKLVRDAHRAGIRPSVTNQALMELGATVCTFRNPRCGICPIARSCRARATERQEEFPPKKKPKQWLSVREELHCLIDHEGRVLLGKRPEGEWRAGLWDLPAARPRGAGRARRIGEIETKYVVTRHKVTRLTHVWGIEPAKGWTAAESDGATLRWVSIERPEVPLGSAVVTTLSRIRERFGKF